MNLKKYAEENMRTSEGISNRRMYKTLQSWVS